MDFALKGELEKVFLTGTEEDVKHFVKVKWQYLPQDIQDRMAIAIMVDGMSGQIQNIENITAFRHACIDVLNALSEEDS